MGIRVAFVLKNFGVFSVLFTQHKSETTEAAKKNPKKQKNFRNVEILMKSFCFKFNFLNVAFLKLVDYFWWRFECSSMGLC